MADSGQSASDDHATHSDRPDMNQPILTEKTFDDTQRCCPKCGYVQPPATECQACGIIFARIKVSPEHQQSHTEPGQQTSAADPATLRQLLLTPRHRGGLALIGTAGLWLAMLCYGGYLVCAGITGNAAGESVLHLVNLPFHEAGHVLFRPFGQFMTSLGGTLGQLLVPIICSVVLLFQQRDPFGAALGLWWLGENLLDIAPYINDARAGALPLVGGNFGHSSPYGFHDWEYLLTETGLLGQDHLLAGLCHSAGGLIMLAALTWGSVLLLRLWQERGGRLV